jgi:predicted negative regulator of RcsB-dependent stress response
MARRSSTTVRRPQDKGAEPDDLFLTQVYWAKQNRPTLVGLGAVIALILLGTLYYVSYRGRVLEQASTELERIHQTLLVGDPQSVRPTLEQFLSRFGSTPYSGEASLMLAEIHLEAGEVEQAIAVLSAANVGLQEPIGVQLATLRGKAEETAGRLDAAEATYLQVADRAELDFQRVQALADAARVRLAQEDHAGAAALYQRIVDMMEDTDPRIGLYRMRLAEARTRSEG